MKITVFGPTKNQMGGGKKEAYPVLQLIKVSNLNVNPLS